MGIAIPTRAEIDAAAERSREYVRCTPVIEVRGADLNLDVDSVVLKLELLQHTGSFKPRGAFNRILVSDVPAAGLIAASGGNHAQAVAYAGTRLESRRRSSCRRRFRSSNWRDYGSTT